MAIHRYDHFCHMKKYPKHFCLFYKANTQLIGGFYFWWTSKSGVSGCCRVLCTVLCMCSWSSRFLERKKISRFTRSIQLFIYAGISDDNICCLRSDIVSYAGKRPYLTVVVYIGVSFLCWLILRLKTTESSILQAVLYYYLYL